jgi:glycosyltransferase involved in cell wall biosynthesis
VSGADLALSLVVPIYNEEENIPPLYQRLTQVLAQGPARYRDSYEIILIDDGSSDGSFSACRTLQQSDARVRVVQFRRNFGKTAALHAGFSHAGGDYVVTIDADMQEDPGDMFMLLDQLDAGDDVVSAWRERRNDPVDKTLPSRVFNAVVSNITGVRLHDFNCGFKAYTSAAVADLQQRLYGDLHRFIPVLAHQRGFRVGEVPVEHRPRRFGKSKYGTKRLLRGYLDFMQVLFLTTYLQRPLRLFGLVGTLFAAIGIAINIHLAWLWLMGQYLSNRPLLFLGILLVVTGLQFVSMGLVGEMLRNSAFRAGDEYSIKQVLEPPDAKADK